MQNSKEFSVQILVNNRAITEVEHGGEIYVEGRNKSVFSIKISNHTGRSVLAVPSVDGLNTIDGKLCGRESAGYIIHPHSSTTVDGWSVDRYTASQFQFRSQGNSGNGCTYTEAIDLSTENQGVVGVMFFDAVPHHVQPTPYYINTTPTVVLYRCGIATASDDGAAGERSLGTGFGSAVSATTTTKTFNRGYYPTDTIVIYYDTIKNLKRIGVPVYKFKTKQADTHRKNPFPLMGESPNGCTPPSGWYK